jgi:hypothetical protein
LGALFAIGFLEGRSARFGCCSSGWHACGIGLLFCRWRVHLSRDLKAHAARVDDPSFNAAIFANLFGGEGDNYKLVCRAAGGTSIRPARATPHPGDPGGAFVMFFNPRRKSSQASAVLYNVTNLPQARSASAMS